MNDQSSRSHCIFIYRGYRYQLAGKQGRSLLDVSANCELLCVVTEFCRWSMTQQVSKFRRSHLRMFVDPYEYSRVSCICRFDMLEFPSVS